MISQIPRSRLQVITFIAVSVFSISQQPQRNSCHMAHVSYHSTTNALVVAEMPSSWLIRVSVCACAALRPETMRSTLVRADKLSMVS